MHMQNTKALISCAVMVQLISAFGFCYIDSTIPLLPQFEISSLKPSSRFVSDLVVSPEDRFSRDMSTSHSSCLLLHYSGERKVIFSVLAHDIRLILFFFKCILLDLEEF